MIAAWVLVTPCGVFESVVVDFAPAMNAVSQRPERELHIDHSGFPWFICTFFLTGWKGFPTRNNSAIGESGRRMSPRPVDAEVSNLDLCTDDPG